MMGTLDNLNDDYVAKLLADDAKKTSQRYVSQGLSALLPQRRNGDMPKPNTRFLSHIVREADSHNTALKRKEEIEAKRRLRQLREDDERPRKRPRTDDTDNSRVSRYRDSRLDKTYSDDSRRCRHRSSERCRELGRDGTSTCRHHSRQSSNRDSTVENKEHRRARRERSNSPMACREERRHTDRVAQSSLKHGSQDNDADEHIDSLATKLPASRVTEFCKETANTQDVVRKRGRGSHKSASGMDDRFQKGYDPSQDVSLDSDLDAVDDDWDLALEALRDRTRWKRSQAARMREAGFEEKDVSKWEASSFREDSRDPPDAGQVKWSRKGETREWDVGKTRSRELL